MPFNYEGVGKTIAVVKNKNNDKVKDKNVYTSWGRQEADALRPHPFRHGFARFQLPPNRNH